MKMYDSKIETPVVQHEGVFHKQLSLGQAVALIVSGTVGAGVLGIPFAVAKIGLVPGVIYIVLLGFLMMGLNLLLGEVVSSTRERFQLVGLAGKYLGKSAKVLMTGLFYAILFGALTIYLIGEGNVLSTLFGGSSLWWSLFFFSLCTFLIFVGLRTVKTVELILTAAVFLVVIFIAAWSTPHIVLQNWQGFDITKLLFPYGIILFAFHGTSAIPQAYTLLPGQKNLFRRAIMISTFICIVLYTLFTITVVGVTGGGTTEIATIGMGEKIGPVMLLFGNIFAALAMGTSYLMVGLSLRDSLSWDYKISPYLSLFVVSGVPLTVFLLGLRQFVQVIDLVGGVFISFELLMIVAIYLRAMKEKHVENKKHAFKPVLFLVALLVLAFSFGAVYSVFKLF